MSQIHLFKQLWNQEVNMYLDSLHINYCELDMRQHPFLDLSHGKKQRFILTRADCFFACRLCRECHRWAEYGTPSDPSSHERLARIHLELIKRRRALLRI